MKKSLVIHFVFFIVFLVILFMNNFQFSNLNRIFIIIYFLAWIIVTVSIFLKSLKK